MMRGAGSPHAAARRGADVATDDGPAYDAGLLRRLWTFVRPHRRLLYLALLMLPVSSGLQLLQPLLMKLAIDRAIVPRQLDLLWPLVAALVGVMVVERLSQLGETLLMQLCGQRAMHDLRRRAHGHMLSLRSAYFDRTPVGQLMTRVTNDVEAISEAFSLGLVSVVGDVITVTGIAVAMLWMSPRLALLTLAVVPVLVVVVEVFRRLLRAAHRVIRQRIGHINATLQEHITGMTVIQIFGQQRRAMAEFDEANAAHRSAYRDAIRYDSSLFAIVEMLGSITVALLLWYGGMRVMDGAVTFGLLVAFVEYVHKLFIPIRDLSAKYTVMQQAMASSERVFALLDTHETEPAAEPTGANAEPAAEPNGDPTRGPYLRFEDVCFAYSPERPVLQGLNLDLPRGRSLALVGATGGGKTTVARLLTRLYEVGSGRILLGGRDLRTLSPTELRRRIVVVSQDVVVFAGTVADNIALGEPGITRAQVEDAARRVGLPRLLDLDREVLERGSNLSAGERQLVAFARALVRDPEVLVLDEATSSIDPESEAIIQQGIAELMQNRTFIVIAHRLSTIEKVDRIAVLHNGKVREEGTHAELLQAGGHYAKLHALQYVRAVDSRELREGPG